jgi:Pyruvate/2-oxoacid:ferredoxin oxidoreductase delta subunit
MRIIDMITENRWKCTGCQACACICAHGAIRMEPDREGFLYPQIENAMCVNCGLCDQVCPSLHPAETEQNRTPDCYAYMSSDEEIRGQSSSGGIVYGAAFDDDWNVHHIRVEKVEDLSRLRGSKYVQSDTNQIFVDVRKMLHNGRQVLFSGTPCQAGALHSYLGKWYENLLVVDIICHGVPSPAVWQQYVQLRKKDSILRIRMRSKKISWEKYFMEFDYRCSDSYQQPLNKDVYLKGFLRNVYLRPSCYQCPYKQKNRSSGITIADFWGIDQIAPDMNDHKGTSLVILHSEKGKEAFARVEGKRKEVLFDDAIRYNPSMVKSVPMNSHRQQFFQLFAQNPERMEEYVAASINKVSFARRIFRRIKRILAQRSRN